MLKCKHLLCIPGQQALNPDELTIVENEELELVSEGDGDGWVQARNYKGEVRQLLKKFLVKIISKFSLRLLIQKQLIFFYYKILIPSGDRSTEDEIKKSKF